MALTEAIQPAQEAVIASYDAVDIADGTGYVTFYGFACTNSTPTTTYHLSNTAITSDPQGIAHGNTTATYDVDFDTTAFNLPRTIKGDAILTFSMNATAAPGAGTVYTVATIYHFDGTTETSLGTQTSPTVSTAATTNRTCQLKIPIAQKLFKKNDILRVNIQFVCTLGGGGNWRGTFGHDPLNRDYIDLVAASYPTFFKVLIPFRINL